MSADMQHRMNRPWIWVFCATAARLAVAARAPHPPYQSPSLSRKGRFSKKWVVADMERHDAANTRGYNEGRRDEEGVDNGERADASSAWHDGGDSDGGSRYTSTAQVDDDNDVDETVAVGVKTPPHHGGKRSNAVGDPDGEGSDDDDDDDDEEMLDLSDFEPDILKDSLLESEMHVEVELLEEDEANNSNDIVDLDDDDEDENQPAITPVHGISGGVGVRLGRGGLPAKRRNNNNKSMDAAKSTATATKLLDEQTCWRAWAPHVYVPPTDRARQYLAEHARTWDGASKARLDRRTLYASLLLEWNVHQQSTTTSSSRRKFLDAATSQALQAALSLATQPSWRQSLPRPSAVRLYNNDHDDHYHRGYTLAMQETVAMALAHSMGVGMLVLDDNVVQEVRQRLLDQGYHDDDAKPAIILQHLLQAARYGRVNVQQQRAGDPQQVFGSLAARMREDLQVGLDDPFDERATASVDDMRAWEAADLSSEPLAVDDPTATRSEATPLPVIIFLRVQSSAALLRSKSVVELLLKECNAPDGVNLLCLGKGIDAKTTTLPPPEPVPDASSHLEAVAHMPEAPQRSLPSAAPWFGFSPHNQNASGQNDPEGSRRFNIFLARTVHPDGTPGILGAIAPPQAGNLFPHMMAMQARERLQQHHDDDSPVKAELERWAQLLQSQMQTNGGAPLPPPQFFNATFEAGENSPPMPPPEVIQQTLQHAMSELLDRLAQMSDNNDGEMAGELSPDLHKAFAQVLRNDNLRRGIADNLARAAPALSDPKCQGVMLSVYVPPPPHHANRGKLPGHQQPPGNRQPMSGWFQKILHNQEEAVAENGGNLSDDARRNARQKRTRTMAAAAAVLAANQAQEKKDDNKEDKAARNLARLEALCRPIVIPTPADPVRAKSWDAWIARERGAVVFRHNRQVLNEQLDEHALCLQSHTGTRGAGSALRQMLSVRDVGEEMADVVKCAVELEAAKSQRLHMTSLELHRKERDLEVDVTLSQLLLTEDGAVEMIDAMIREKPGRQYVHPSSLETALSVVCRLSPSPASGGGWSMANTVSHRTREEIAALAQDKHERALVSQVVSPHDIGVTYDMIGGLSQIKELLRQSITYPLKFPHLYSEGIAREAVKGVLLFGPPGTGKTMLAKAVATEGGASFLSVDASSVENKWLGESEKNAKAVFTLARRLAPCVVFIDEVDSLLSSREGTSDDSAHGTLTSVKTTMMSEWDGLNSGTNGAGEAGADRVIVIGSTNRPFDLDEAVLRRFPRRILVDLPDLETRTEILEVTLAENRMDPAVNLTQIAERLEGYTGSDIKEVCREAVVQISHEQAKILDQGFWNSKEDVTQGSLQRLRPVTVQDFEQALSKLQRSVSEKGRELARVWEWNDEYGEIKKEKKSQLPHLASMYL